MKTTMLIRILILILLAFFIDSGAFALLTDSPPAGAETMPPPRIIVKFVENSAISLDNLNVITPKSGRAEFDRLSRKYQVNQIAPLFKKGGQSSSGTPFDRVFILDFPGGTDIENASAAYAALDYIEYAEPDYAVEFYDFPEDYYFTHQWSYHNQGQGHYHILRRPGYQNDKMIITRGTDDADVDALEIYQNPPDNTLTAVVAIIDTGVDIDHPELNGRIWINPRETADNGIDDDNNGYIDDIHGWDFAAGDVVYEVDLEDNDPTDEFGHGTHCAGIVAAVADNGSGISGLIDNCRIMALKIHPWPLVSKIARAVIYAADNGADVINMSFGMPYRSFLLEDALAYARSRGVVPCAASGNSGIEEYNFPAAFDATICVGATNDSDHVTDFSTYGSHLDLCAPGLAILSLRADSSDMYGDDDTEPFVHIVSDIYYLSSGTSMSCPHAVGAAAWIKAASPGLTAEKTIEILRLSSDDYLDPYGRGDNLPGWDIYSGYGRINLQGALAMTPALRAEITSPRLHEIVSGEVAMQGYADGADFASYIIEYAAADDTMTWFPVVSSSMPVTDGLLGTWNTAGLTGNYSLRLRSGPDHAAWKSVFVANESVAEIVFPVEGDTLSGYLEILVNAYAPDFKNVVIEYSAVASPDEWVPIASSSVPLINEGISEWILEALSEGEYDIRLSVFVTGRMAVSDQVRVYVRSFFDGERAWKNNFESNVSIIANYGDFDADGINEIALGHESGIAFMTPEGAPKTSGMPAFPENSYLIPPAVGNLDDDGIDDIVAFGAEPAKLYAFPSTAPPFEINLGVTPEINSFSNMEADMCRLALKDLDNDGRDEIHVAAVNNDEAEVVVYDDDGSPLIGFGGIRESQLADLDGDGLDEFYYFDPQTGYLKKSPDLVTVTDSLFLNIDGERLYCRGMSAADIDNDGRRELIALGFVASREYWLFALKDGLNLVDGWPHNLEISYYLVPTMPVFADLDQDGQLEYISTSFTISYGYVHAWNLDGSAFIPGNPAGFFARTDHPAVNNMPLVGDISGDNYPDIILCANEDMFSTYQVQRIYAWDKSGTVLDGFPLIVVPETPYYFTSSFRYVPSLGDINRDGFADMIMPTADSSLIFVEFVNSAFIPDNNPVPFWRYSRRMNNVAPMISPAATDVDDESSAPGFDYAISRNYPNPFNASTIISYRLTAAAEVKLDIFNILGQKVKTLLEAELPSGKHDTGWDGTDDRNRPLASGIYFYRLDIADHREIGKMVLLR